MLCQKGFVFFYTVYTIIIVIFLKNFLNRVVQTLSKTVQNKFKFSLILFSTVFPLWHNVC